ncbi:MAG: signal peptidase I [Lachnospiraceae bacterium]|uniref:signal peptidase I n=1 Tax=Roseburia hominis TaxID=301301 RepID=UPI001F3ADDE0|nr:signal peptidase I [Roseburia hominis]MCI5712298.1 signal peptidase I [Lachnospiraceae bacterium]MDD6168673.1 signal peptidase I [Lachnospiraceae bacterium]MDY4838150.1 signal peptidase I [Lachnospiraceae bacterium]
MRKYRNNGLDFNRRKKNVNIPLVKEIVAWIVEIAIVLAIAFVFVFFFGMRTSVVGQSMAETLDNGDQILVNRFIYKVVGPKANDVVVFLPNGNEKSHYYVKRVVGVPGDTIQIKDGKVYINGAEAEEKIDVSAIEDAGLAADAITLEEDEYFVLGDNRNNSEDSRYANIGNIKREYLVGKAWFVLTTGDRFGFIR